MFICPQCEAPVRLPAKHWPAQWPPYVCGECGQHWASRYHLAVTFPIHEDIKPLWPLMSWQQASKWAQGNGLKPYVYALTYPNGLPFYVGKGNKLRLLQHGAFLRLSDLWRHVKPPRDEKEAVLWQLAGCRAYERYAILAICDSDQEAFELEAVAIKRYGRREAGGLLCNATQAVDVSAAELPPMPAIAEMITDGEKPWNLAPGLNPRGYKAGKVCWCPKCDQPGMIAMQEPVAELLCPVCFHYFELIDNYKLRKWIPEGFAAEALQAYETEPIHG